MRTLTVFSVIALAVALVAELASGAPSSDKEIKIQHIINGLSSNDINSAQSQSRSASSSTSQSSSLSTEEKRAALNGYINVLGGAVAKRIQSASSESNAQSSQSSSSSLVSSNSNGNIGGSRIVIGSGRSVGGDFLDLDKDNVFANHNVKSISSASSQSSSSSSHHSSSNNGNLITINGKTIGDRGSLVSNHNAKSISSSSISSSSSSSSHHSSSNNGKLIAINGKTVGDLDDLTANRNVKSISSSTSSHSSSNSGNLITINGKPIGNLVNGKPSSVSSSTHQSSSSHTVNGKTVSSSQFGSTRAVNGQRVVTQTEVSSLEVKENKELVNRVYKLKSEAMSLKKMLIEADNHIDKAIVHMSHMENEYTSVSSLLEEEIKRKWTLTTQLRQYEHEMTVVQQQLHDLGLNNKNLEGQVVSIRNELNQRVIKMTTEYENIKLQLKNAELRTADALKTVSETETRLRKAETSLDTETKHKVELTKRLTEVESVKKDLMKRLKDDEDTIRNLEDKVVKVRSELTDRLTKITADADDYKNRLRDSEDRYSTATKTIKTVETRLQETQLTLDKENKLKADLDKQLRNILVEKENLANELVKEGVTIKDLKGEVGQVRAEMTERVAKLVDESNKIKNQLIGAEERVTTTTKTLETLKVQLRDYETQLSKETKLRTDLNNQLKDLEKEREVHTRMIKSEEDIKKQLENQVNVLNHQITSYTHKYELETRKVTELQVIRQTITQDNERLRRMLKEMQDTNDDLENKKISMMAELEANKLDLAHHKQIVVMLEKKLKNMEKEIIEENKETEEVEKERDEVRSKLRQKELEVVSITRQMVESRERFSKEQKTSRQLKEDLDKCISYRTGGEQNVVTSVERSVSSSSNKVHSSGSSHHVSSTSSHSSNINGGSNDDSHWVVGSSGSSSKSSSSSSSAAKSVSSSNSSEKSAYGSSSSAQSAYGSSSSEKSVSSSNSSQKSAYGSSSSAQSAYGSSSSEKSASSSSSSEKSASLSSSATNSISVSGGNTVKITSA